MRRNGLVYLFIIYLFMFWGCNDSKKVVEETTSTLDKVIKTKELHVGYFIFEPTIMRSKAVGELEGVFIEMIEEIAKSISPNTKVIYHETTLSEFSIALNTNKFDLCIGATFATPQRATSVLFTKPLFYCGYTGVVKKDMEIIFNNWEDINTTDVTTSVLKGSAIADLVRTDFKDADVLSFPGKDLTLPLAAVSSGQADIGLMNQITVFTYLRSHPELKEVFTNAPLGSTNFSWSVRPNDTKWLNYLNTCIQYLKNTGAMTRYEEKYDVPLMHKKSEYYFSNRN